MPLLARQVKAASVYDLSILQFPTFAFQLTIAHLPSLVLSNAQGYIPAKFHLLSFHSLSEVRAAIMSLGVNGFPSKIICPSSWFMIPLKHLIKVDLPAPFSPNKAWTLPFLTKTETLLRATVAPNCFLIFF